MSELDELRRHLSDQPPGAVGDTTETAQLLAVCWEHLSGDNGGMAGYKLHDRMESVEWRPPILHFVIDRHGGTVLGSSRATLQSWTVDVNKATRTVADAGFRQISPSSARFNVGPIAEEICRAIQTRTDDPRVKRMKDGRVQLRMSVVVPWDSGFKQTVTNRRKRLREALEPLLEETGWKTVRANVFEPSDWHNRH